MSVRPPEWTRRDRGAWFKPSMVVAPLLALGALISSFDDPVTGALLCAGAVALVAVALLLPPRRPLRVALGDVRLPNAVVRGVQFPLRRPRVAVTVWAVLALVFLATAVLLAVYAVANDKPSHLIGTAVIGLFGALFTMAVVAYLRRDRTNPPSVTLGAAGVVLVGNSARLIPWDEITGVTATIHEIVSGWWTIRQNAITIATAGDDEAGGGLRRFASFLVGNGDATVRNVQFDTDPVAAFHTLRFYWQHPDARGELTSEASVGRVRAGRLEPVR
jgi:hypothetical protein